MTRESINGRLTTLFLRHGAEGQFTKLFSNLENEHRIAMLQEVELMGGEIPTLVHYINPMTWTLVTTDHVYCRDRHGIGTIEASDISADGDDLYRSPRRPSEGVLDIKLRNGHKVIALFEPGVPMNGAWNALRLFVNRNRLRSNSPSTHE